MTEPGRNTTHKRWINFWRIAWAVSTLITVEIVVCGLSATPVVILWWQLVRIRSSSALLQIIMWSAALIPSYIIFALALLFASPLALRLVGWRTPTAAEMRIADIDWQLLNFVRYAAANHFVRVMAGTFFRGSPIWTVHLRLGGARLGRRVYVNSLGPQRLQPS